MGKKLFMEKRVTNIVGYVGLIEPLFFCHKCYEYGHWAKTCSSVVSAGTLSTQWRSVRGEADRFR